MRIAYIHYLVENDTGRHHVRQFADAARSLGHRVDVLAMNLAAGDVPSKSGIPSTYSRLRRSLKRRFGRYLHEPKELLWNLLYVPRELRLLQHSHPNVLLVRDHLLTISCIPVSRRLRIPLVLEKNAPAEESRLYLRDYAHLPMVPAWFERAKLRHAEAITAVSSGLRDHLLRRYSIPATKIVVIPNGADLRVFRPGAPIDPEASTLGGTGPVIGFVGSFRLWHGTALLAGVIQEVARQRPGARFLLVGDGPERGTLQERLATLGDRVYFTGQVSHDRVPGLVAGFDIGVLPDTLFYASPLKLIEWLAAGKSVVAPAYPSLRDVIEDGVNGILFPPADGKALVGAILRLIDDDFHRRALSKTAAERAHASLSWDENARRVADVCARAVSGYAAAR